MLGQSRLGHTMQTSQWAFAVVEMIHLLAIAALGGSLLIIDLRLLGLVLTSESATRIARDLGRIFLVSLTVLILSGICLLAEESLKCYFSTAFRWKMVLLSAGILFYFTVHRRTLRDVGSEQRRIRERAVAVLSLSLWLGVGVAGRAIGLV